MATILIVEDDKSAQLLTAARLKGKYNVICASNGEEALDKIYGQHIDLIVADIMMPKMDGYTLLKTIRKEKLTIPVLLLTAKQSFEDKREGFSLGTDDYMTKPVNYDELLWRIAALLKRSKISAENKISVGNVIIDATSYTVTVGDKAIELPKKEFELLYKLLSYPNQIFTKDQLLDEIWGYDSESGDDTVKVHINRLRNKLLEIDNFTIVTVRGIGYKGELK